MGTFMPKSFGTRWPERVRPQRGLVDDGYTDAGSTQADYGRRQGQEHHARDRASECALRRRPAGRRCHYKRAAGTPDVAWPSLRVAVFVDGAFWHGHVSRHKPGRSGEYWDTKIARNVERDRQADDALRAAGWTVVRVWDFEIRRNLPAVVERIKDALRERASGGVDWQRRLIG